MRKINRIKNMCGSATVEAVVGFTAFLFTVFTIMNVVNYCRAQMLVANALDNAAKELTQYSYFYKMSGLNKISNKAGGAYQASSDDVNDIIDTVDGLYQSLGDAKDDAVNTVNLVKEGFEKKDATELKGSISDAFEGVRKNKDAIKENMDNVQKAFNEVKDDPVYYLKSIALIAGSTSLDMVKSHLIAAPLAKALFMKHFGSNKDEADEALEKLGIVGGIDGMNFDLSTIFSAKEPEDIHLIVYYNVKLTTFFKGLDLSATFCKESRARAWLAGDNVDFCGTAAAPTDENIKSFSDEEMKEFENPTNLDADPDASTEDNKEEQVDTTGSYWNKNDSEDQFDELYKSTHSNLNYAGLNAAYGELGTEQLVAANQTTAYGYTAVKEWQTLHILNSRLTQIESLNNSKEIGQKSLQSGMSYSDGTPLAGISPTVQEYHLTVYVPENMDEGAPEERTEMVRVLGEMADKYNDAGYSFTYEIVPAGGNYDYSND